MTRVRTLLDRIRDLRHRPEVENQLDEEVQFHLEMQTALNVSQGCLPRKLAARRRDSPAALNSTTVLYLPLTRTGSHYAWPTMNVEVRSGLEMGNSVLHKHDSAGNDSQQ